MKSGPSWVRAAGTSFVSDGRALQLRGINLGGWLLIEGWIICLNRDVPKEKRLPDERALWRLIEKRFGARAARAMQKAHHDRWITGEDFVRIREAGFNFVRVPFWHEWLNHDRKPDRIDPKGWKYLDRAVEWGKDVGLWVLLDLHGAPGSQSPWDHTGVTGRNELFKKKSFQARTVRLWREVARRYRDEPAVLGYDLLNEPNGGTPEQIANLHNRIYAAIRSEDRNHLIVIEDGLHGLDTMPHPEKYAWGNVAYSTHFYLFEAGGDEPHEKFTAEQVPKWRNEQVRVGVPLYIGEFNAISPEWGLKAMRRYVEAFERYGWAWSPWTYKNIEGVFAASLWGLYRNPEKWRRYIDPYRASKRQLLRYFQRMETGNLELNRAYAEALGVSGTAPRDPETSA